MIATDHAAHDPDRFTMSAGRRRYRNVPARAGALLLALHAGGLRTRPAEQLGANPTACLTGPGVLR